MNTNSQRDRVCAPHGGTKWYKIRANSGNTRWMFEPDLAGGTWLGAKPVKVIGAISASHARPDSKTSRPGVGVSLSAAMSTTWTRYYDAAGEQPRETLLFALERFDAEAGAKGRGLFAVDLGCGTGRDSAELLRRGWRVLAIDAEAEAIQRLLGRGDLRSGGAARLETQVARFEDAGWSEADLINSSYALPSVRRTSSRRSGSG